MLEQGGWRNVQVEELTWTWHATRQQLWASVEGGVASAGALFLSLGEAERHRFRGAFDKLVTERMRDGTVAFEHTAALAVGLGV